MIIRLAGIAALLAVLFFLEAPDHTLFWDAFFNAGHAPLFGLVALLIRSLEGLTPGENREVQRSVRAIVITLVLGAATELLQLFLPMREASVGDFLRDAAGGTAFLLLRAAVAAPRTPVRSLRDATGRVASGLLAVSLLLAVAMPLFLALVSYVERDRAFPILFRLDGSRWEQPFVSTRGAELVPKAMPDAGPASGSGPLALLTLRPGYPRLVLHEPYPDWRGFRRLVFTAFSDVDAPLTLTIRVHDVWHAHRYEGRFNKRILITRGGQQIAIPLDEIRNAPRGGKMDLQRVRGIELVAIRLKQPAHLYLGAFRLE